VERVNRTLQDRLVKELRLEGVSTIEAANIYLPAFVARFNDRFATVPARPENLHRPLERPTVQLDTILAWREQRYVTQQLALSYDSKRIILDETPLTAGLVGKYVETYEFPDGRFEVRWQGVALPHRVFDKKQRVTHAAIVENKRLSEALAWVKARQDAIEPVRTKTNSEAHGTSLARKDAEAVSLLSSATLGPKPPIPPPLPGLLRNLTSPQPRQRLRSTL